MRITGENISGRPAVFCPHLKTNKPAAVSNIFSIDKLEIGTNLKEKLHWLLDYQPAHNRSCHVF